MNDLLRLDLTVFLRLIRPHALTVVALQFGLGAAIARYLGQGFPASRFFLGLSLLLFLSVATTSLDTFFNEGGESLDTEPTLRIKVGESASRVSLRSALYAGILSLTAAATLGSILTARGSLGAVSALLLLGGSLAAIAFAAPPLRLSNSGYSELLASFLLAAGIPTFSYALLTGDLHRLLLMSSAPLVAVTFAGLLALQLPSYGREAARESGQLMVRLGWRTGMRVHDVSLLLGYLLLAIALTLGLPRRVGLGSLLTLPLALAQIWYLARIRDGAPARWWLLRLSSYGLIGLLPYLELSGYLLS